MYGKWAWFVSDFIKFLYVFLLLKGYVRTKFDWWRFNRLWDMYIVEHDLWLSYSTSYFFLLTLFRWRGKVPITHICSTNLLRMSRNTTQFLRKLLIAQTGSRTDIRKWKHPIILVNFVYITPYRSLELQTLQIILRPLTKLLSSIQHAAAV